MNVFFEFHKIVHKLQKDEIPYALIGGVAMAFHSFARFTQDIDLLIKREGLEPLSVLLKAQGYLISAEPWSFENGLELHRFMKGEGEDEMILDVLVAKTERQIAVVDQALTAVSEESGTVRVASREDLIWLKSLRNSPMDQIDIQNLKDESRDPSN